MRGLMSSCHWKWIQPLTFLLRQSRVQPRDRSDPNSAVRTGKTSTLASIYWITSVTPGWFSDYMLHFSSQITDKWSQFWRLSEKISTFCCYLLFPFLLTDPSKQSLTSAASTPSGILVQIPVCLNYNKLKMKLTGCYPGDGSSPGWGEAPPFCLFKRFPRSELGGGNDEPAHENVPQPIGNWWWQKGGM